MFKVKVRHFLHEMVLDLLHPIFYFPIGDQILRLLKMVPSDYPWPKTLDLSPKTFSTMFRTKVTISLLEVVLGLLQPLHPDLQVDLRFLTMVPMISHDQGGVLLGLGDQGGSSWFREGDQRGLSWVDEVTKYWHFWSK